MWKKIERDVLVIHIIVSNTLTIHINEYVLDKGKNPV